MALPRRHLRLSTATLLALTVAMGAVSTARAEVVAVNAPAAATTSTPAVAPAEVRASLLYAPATTRPVGTEAERPEILVAKDSRFGLPRDPRSGRAWLSGVWLGGNFNPAALRAFGDWRGSSVETVTTYSEKSTFAAIRDEDWSISTFAGFEGTLVYGLSLLPFDQKASLADVAAGKYDDVWKGVARNLLRHGRGDSIVRIGLEANGTWFPWGATSGSAPQFRPAFRRVSSVLKSVAPDLLINFDIGCGVPLTGSSDRLAPLTRLYPGDEAVDIIGCDIYDWWTTRASSDSSWQKALRPAAGPGLADVAAFARARNKGMSIPEWGVAPRSQGGLGDNSLFIAKMRAFMDANRDVLVFENYFNEPETSLASSLWNPVQNSRASAQYRALW